MMIPKTYRQWYHCITKECGIAVTQDFISHRLAVFEDPKHQETRRFVSLYGQTHLENIIGWLKKAEGEISGR